MKKKCIFVIGPESSGSTLIAKIISTALNGSLEWSGKGFNCCNFGSCDCNNNFLQPCKDVKHLVCHRSLPFFTDAEWPPIEEWKLTYDAHFIICTRDTTISKISVTKRFKRKPETISEQQSQARKIIGDILKSESKSFIWSYETFMYLQEDYLRELFYFLDLESDYFPESIKDANMKYIDINDISKSSERLKNVITTKYKNALKRFLH